MRNYIIFSSVILLLIGILGFAFKESLNIPAWALLVDIILGLWGMVVLFEKKK